MPDRERRTLKKKSQFSMRTRTTRCTASESDMMLVMLSDCAFNNSGAKTMACGRAVGAGQARGDEDGPASLETS